MDEAAFSRMLDAIYEAPASPEQWHDALAGLGRAFACNAVTLIDRDLRTMRGMAIVMGVDAASHREFFNDWRDRNVFVNKTRVFRPGVIVTDREMLPRADLLKSDFYNGFLKPRDLHSTVRISLRVENGIHHSISLHRPPSRDEFERGDVERACLFLPHLRRAAAMSRHLEQSRLMTGVATEILEDHAIGILLLDRPGRVIFANRAAQAMAEKEDGFLLRQDRIEVLGTGHDAVLTRLIAGALGRAGEADAARGGVMRLPRRSGSRDYAVAVVRLASSQTLFGALVPAAFVLITDPDASPKPPQSLLREIYGLTAMEGRLAERLVTGETLAEAAEALGIRMPTAKTHINSLFRKTETNRQSNLVRLLLSLPWTSGDATAR